MAAMSLNPVAVAFCLLLNAGLAAATDHPPPSPGCNVAAGNCGPADVVAVDAQASAAQDPVEAKQKPKKPKKAAKPDAQPAGEVEDATGKTEGVHFVWKTAPSLRAGKHVRVDFRLKLQTDFRRSDQDLAPAGGLFDVARRRAGVKGSLFRVVEFEIERELASGGPWRDVYVNLRPVAAVQFQAGKFKVPFSLDQLTPSHELDFVYRSLAGDTLAPDRDVGAMVHGQVWRHFIQYQAGVFRGDGENSPRLEAPPLLPGEVLSIPSKRSFAGRVRVRPLSPLPVPKIFDTLEIGGSAMRSEVAEGLNHLQGKTVFGTKFFGRNFYIKGPRTRRSLEMSWTPGPVSIRAEYLRVEEAREGVGSGDETGLDNNLPALPSKGWYVSGTWAITGDKKASGLEPRRPFLAGGLGAIEVAARYETLRFGGGVASESPSISPRAGNAAGNEEQVVTLGVNWYLNRFVKVQLNGIRERLEDVSTSPVAGRATFWSVACRLQFAM